MIYPTAHRGLSRQKASVIPDILALGGSVMAEGGIVLLWDEKRVGDIVDDHCMIALRAFRAVILQIAVYKSLLLFIF